MEATSLLTCLHTAGLTITRTGDQLVVAPRERLTDDLRNAIRDAKPQLLSVLAPNPSLGQRPGPTSHNLEQRIRLMAKRWGYSAEELAEALAGAKSDSQGWLVWTERDELDFGACVTREDFVQAYARIRGLA
jgi:hypothetical protein